MVERLTVNQIVAGSSPALPSKQQACNSIWLEYLTFNQRVVGSSPTMPTNYGDITQLAECLTLNQKVVGSNPTIPTK